MASSAVILGPGEPAFLELAESASEALGADLYQGGCLQDPNSITDYDLFVFESSISEGNGRRETGISYLIRVDETGARSVNWEILANLNASQPSPRVPHPAKISNAEVAARLSHDKDLETRRQALAAWLSQARTQLQQLPNDLTDHMTNREERLTARRKIETSVKERINMLEGAVMLSSRELTRVGWAHVHATGLPAEPQEKDSEVIAMTHVAQALSNEGWGVADRHKEKDLGYDLHATRGREQRCVEIKGVWESAASQGVRMTGQEIAKAGLLGQDYWLYVVDQCKDGKGTLFHAWRDPAAVFAEAAQDVATIRIPGSALTAARGTSV